MPSDTWGGANFGPRGIIRTNLVEIHKVVLHTKYQGSEAVRFQTRRFYHAFSFISLRKTYDPHRQGKFSPQGDNLIKLGRGPLGDATYQIPRL